MATREEVLDWMAAEKAGAKTAARHFDIPLGTVKSWRARDSQKRAKLAVAHEESGGPQRPQTSGASRVKPATTERDPAAMSPVAFWTDQVQALHSDAEAARQRGHSGAVAVLAKQLGDARRRLDEAIAADRSANRVLLTREQKRAKFAEQCAEMPDSFLEIAVLAYCKRHDFVGLQGNAGEVFPIQWPKSAVATK